MAEVASYCTHCGAKIEPSSKFCSSCGKQISLATEATPTSPRAATAPKEREMTYNKKEEKERLKRLKEADKLAEESRKEQEKEKKRILKTYDKKIKAWKAYYRASIFFFIFGIFAAFIGLMVAGGVGALVVGGFFALLGWGCSRTSQKNHREAMAYANSISGQYNNNNNNNS